MLASASWRIDVMTFAWRSNVATLLSLLAGAYPEGRRQLLESHDTNYYPQIRVPMQEAYVNRNVSIRRKQEGQAHAVQEPPAALDRRAGVLRGVGREGTLTSQASRTWHRNGAHYGILTAFSYIVVSVPPRNFHVMCNRALQISLRRIIICA